MSICRKITALLVVLFTAAVILPSCEKEEDHHTREVVEKKGVRLSMQIDDLKPVDTKSVLEDPYIETKITSVTLAAYSVTTGQLASADYFSAGEEVVLDLAQDSRATVYALVNMGDMTGVLPANESGISAVTYDIPAYTGSDDSIEERGIPMAGVLDFDEDDPTGTIISVRRLLAKVAVDLSLDWDATISTVQIKGMNKHLTPFGASAARSSSDTFSEEIESGHDLSSGTFVFYIPENEQGSVPSITSSSDKSGDNSALSAVKDRLTYMEVTAAGTGLYSGTMVYRSYLGKNATSDFSITRNCRYTWSVTYRKDGTMEDDWKHENNLSWSAWRYTLTANSTIQKNYSGYIGDSAQCILRRRVDTYEKGIKSGGLGYQPTDPDIVSWTPEYWEPGNFMSHSHTVNIYSSLMGYYLSRVYTMDAAGSGTVRCTIEDEMGTFTDEVGFYCAGPKPSLVLGVTPASIPLGGTFQFSLDMHSQDDSWNCLDDARFHLSSGRFGTEVRSGYTFDVTDDSNNEYIGTDGRWTPTETGTYVMTASSSKNASYDIVSNTITLTVTEPNVESYVLRIDPVNPTPRMVGEVISLNAYLDKYVNGIWSVTMDAVTSSAVWSCENAAVSVTNGSVTSMLPGTFTINASYDGPDGELNASVNVTFTADTNYITLTASPASVYVGEASTATVLWNGSSNVTPSSTVTAYTSESGSTVSGIVSISGGTVTGTSVGICYLEARYTAGGKTYRSARVRLDVVPDAYTITLSPKPGAVQMGKTLQFSYTMTRNGAPFTPSAGDISWSVISGADKATISGSGLASGVSTGTATVKVAYKSDVAFDTAALEVTAPSETYRLVSLTVTPNPLYVGGAGGTSVVKYQKYVNGVKTGSELTLDNGSLNWGSSNTGIATVGSTGVVTPVAAGTSTITATYNGSAVNFETGHDSISANVTVIAESYRLVSLTVTPNPLSVGGVNGTSVVKYRKYVNGVVTGEEKTLSNNYLNWGSSNTGIATVGSTGVVVPVAAGTSTITATYNGSSLNFEAGYDSISAEVTVLGPLTLSWASIYTDPKYVAQMARVQVSGQASSGLTISYSVKGAPSNIQFMGPTPGGVFVGFLAAGDYTIVATASNGQTGEFSFTVNNPVAVQEWTSQAMWVDGTPTGKMLHYETLEGTPMTVASADNYGYGTRFAPSLYEDYLKPSIWSITPQAHGHFTGFLEMENDAIYVKTLKYSTSDARGYIGNWLGTQFDVIIKAGVQEFAYQTSFKDPFEDVNVTNNVETFHDFTTAYDHMTSSQVSTYSAPKTYTLSSKSTGRVYANANNVLAQTSDELQDKLDAVKGTYTGSRTISLELTAGNEYVHFYHPSGVKNVYLHVQNSYDIAAGSERARYSVSKQIGEAKIYLHVVWATVMKPQSHSSQYIVDVLNNGYEKNDPNDVWDIRYLYGGFLNNLDAASNSEAVRLLVGLSANDNNAFVRLAREDRQGFTSNGNKWYLVDPYGFIRHTTAVTTGDCQLGLGYAVLKTSGTGYGTCNWSQWKANAATSPFCRYNPQCSFTKVSWSQYGLAGHYFTDIYSEKDDNYNGYLIVHMLQDMPVNPNNGYIE